MVGVEVQILIDKGLGNRLGKSRVLVLGDNVDETRAAADLDADTLVERLDQLIRGGRVRGVAGAEFREVGKVICITDPAAAAMRDAKMRAAMQAAIADPSIRPPPPPPWRLGKGMTATNNQQAGLLSFQGIVEYQGKTGLFDDVVGGGFTLIGTTFDPAEFLSPENRAFFDRIGGIVAHVTPDGPVRDVDGGYAAWFAENGIGASLARPDFYQVGATDDPSGVNALVDVVRIAMTVERVSETVI